jgi:hypothetical protein
VNTTAVVFQYLLDNVEARLSCVQLTIEGCSVSFSNGVFTADKTISSKQFPLTDPKCAENLAKFIEEVEDEVIYLNIDDYFMVIGKKTLKVILEGPEDFKKKFVAVREQSFPHFSGNSIYHDYYVSYDEKDFNEFSCEFLEAES